MTIIKLCDIDGYLYAMALPDDEEDCENGPVLGPPPGLTKEVHNAFAKAGIYNAIDLLGTPRRDWLRILGTLDVPKNYSKTVLHIYQREYFV